MSESSLFCLIEESLGKQWYFSLSNQETIEYTWREENSWAKPIQLDGQPVKQFKVTIDKNDCIHLLAYNRSKKLIYYEWNGNQWYHRLLYNVQSRFENISHIETISTLNRIHIFYYIENALKRAQESLVHSWFQNGKWQSNILLNFITDQNVKLQLIQHDSKGNLFVIYTRLLRNDTRCYFIYYDNERSSWSKPFILFQQPGICINFHGHADSNGSFHITWVEKTGAEYRLKYKKVIPNSLNSNTETFCILDNGVLPIDYTCLHIDGDALYCYWIQEGSAFVCHGDISGMHWGESKEIAQGPFQIYRKVSKSLDGNPRVETKIGDGYPEFSWTLESHLSANETRDKKLTEEKHVSIHLPGSKKPNNTHLSEDDEMDNYKDPTLYHSIEKIQEAMKKFQLQIKEINSRLDDFHAALYQLQDYIRQKDKNSFQREAQIRKLAFEIEQIRAMRTNIPIINTTYNEDNHEKNIIDEDKPSDIQVDESQKKEELPKNVDLGSGEIQLGNVSIFINPEDDSED